MRYEVALEKLYAMQTRGVRMGIERMQAALRYRGFDMRATPYVQVAGTNGKGSVSAMVAECLRASGHRVGLFTSPHLHRFTERVRIDGKPLSVRETGRRISELLEVFGQPGAPEMTFFEISTLLAVEAFRDHECDIAVLEVGLGGRLDATNALPAELTVITRIAFDHMQYLGDTLPEIAREKAGIIKRGVPVIVGAKQAEAIAEIQAHAKRKHAPLWLLGRELHVLEAPDPSAARFAVETPHGRTRPLTLALPGTHQRDNAACAVAVLHALHDRGFGVNERAIVRGLARVRWPARLETLGTKPELLLDAAHNPDGCAALARHLHTLPRRAGRRVLVFGAMADKDIKTMLRELRGEIDEVIYAPPPMSRAATAATLRKARRGEVASDVSQALTLAKRKAGPRGLVIVAGSIFLVAEARAKLLGLRADPLIRM